MSGYPPSPVPADEHLHPEDLPFTAFGQFGEGQMDNRVFDQDTWWVDVRGCEHLLTEMSEDYRRNVIAFCRENAEYFHLFAMLRCAREMALALLEDRPSGDALARMAGDRIEDLTAWEWVESTPLLRRLRALTPPA